ncbi:zinc transporter ZIP1 isoform X1 [Drosophila innubila]|uniref:zinc transporter ZIP1 isoform X1 n=1 Tax=Drosophila innubila TaxID=198719 RepID=UPI00148D740E|nr:zinc transporter ZIP1 isoform X1 [Drosophila innubila]
MNQTQVNNFLKCFLQIDEPVSHLAARHDEHDHDHDHEHDHDHDHDHNDDSGSLLTAKVTAMVVLCCASALCGSIPFLLNRFYHWTENQTNARSATVVKCLLYFGGGVLLATTFLHLLPEVQEVVKQLQQCKIIGQLSFPLAELLMCCGFFLMYFIEEAMHAYMHRFYQDDASAAFERGHSIRHSHLMKSATAPAANSAELTTPPLTSPPNGSLSVQDLMQNDLEQQKYGAVHHQKHSHSHSHNHGHGHGHSHMAMTDGSGDVLTSSLRGLFIVLALSLHELFEGMAIGLEGSASSVWFMFGAVSAHKLVLAFCVGVELIVARTRLSLSVLYVLTFAVVSPLGIGLGILISHGHSGGGPSLISAILQGFACGTLIYVVFFEILSKNRSGLLAYLALLVGFLVMFGLQQLGDGHGHSHGSCSSADDHDHDHDHHDHHHSEIETSSDHHSHHSEAEELVASQKDQEKLQVLRQVIQYILEAHPKHK